MTAKKSVPAKAAAPAAKAAPAKGAKTEPEDKKKAASGPEALFKKLDANDDGKLSPEEFGKAPEQPKVKGATKVKAKKADDHFRRLDADNDGALSLNEFKGIGELKKKTKADK